MRKSRSFCLFLLTAAAMTHTALGQENDLNTFSNTEPIVRDEAAREQGKINVQNVVEELRQLLHTPSTALGKRTIMPPDEPTFVEIPDVDGKSTLIYFCRNTTANKIVPKRPKRKETMAVNVSVPLVIPEKRSPDAIPTKASIL